MLFYTIATKFMCFIKIFPKEILRTVSSYIKAFHRKEIFLTKMIRLLFSHQIHNFLFCLRFITEFDTFRIKIIQFQKDKKFFNNFRFWCCFSQEIGIYLKNDYVMLKFSTWNRRFKQKNITFKKRFTILYNFYFLREEDDRLC